MTTLLKIYCWIWYQKIILCKSVNTWWRHWQENSRTLFYSQCRTHQYCQQKQNLSQKYDNHPCCSPGMKLEALSTSIVILWWGWEMKVERLDSCT